VTVLAAFGDSIANGLGSEGASYPRLLADRLGATYVDVTATSSQLSDCIRSRERAKGADIALIAFGITEAMIRPTPGSLRFMPRRWRPAGWMDPRPYYSGRLAKRVPQRLDSALRWRMKVALIRLSGGMRWGEPTRYERELDDLVAWLLEQGTSTVVIVGRFGHDERYFPGSGPSADEFLEANRRVAHARGVLFCEGSGICRQWGDYLLDHFHPNELGHRRIADRLADLF
jgi:hypothetical protein